LAVVEPQGFFRRLHESLDEIDFAGLSENQIEMKGKKLEAKAEARGWQYQPPAIP
jgi:hypothetical protein